MIILANGVDNSKIPVVGFEVYGIKYFNYIKTQINNDFPVTIGVVYKFTNYGVAAIFIAMIVGSYHWSLTIYR